MFERFDPAVPPDVPPNGYELVVKRAGAKAQLRRLQILAGAGCLLVVAVVGVGATVGASGRPRVSLNVQGGSGGPAVPLITESVVAESSPSPVASRASSPSPPPDVVPSASPGVARTHASTSPAEPSPPGAPALACPAKIPTTYQVMSDPPGGTVAPGGAAEGLVCLYNMPTPPGAPVPRRDHILSPASLDSIVSGLNASMAPDQAGPTGRPAVLNCPAGSPIDIIFLDYGNQQVLAFDEGSNGCSSLRRIEAISGAATQNWVASPQLLNTLGAIEDGQQ